MHLFFAWKCAKNKNNNDPKNMLTKVNLDSCVLTMLAITTTKVNFK